jgi:monoamine oxidase
LTFDVAIVGAGAAGLMAARVLGAAGKRIVVLEARDRAGGRMHTLDAAGAGAPIELGPEFVHGSPASTRALLREAGDAVVDNGERAFAWDGRGLEESTHDDFAAAERILAPALQRGRDCSVDAWLRECAARGIDPQRLQRTRDLVAGFDAADPARASVQMIAHEWTGDATADGTQSRPIRGYARAVAHLVATLAPHDVDIRYGHVVTTIERNATGVIVRVQSAAGAIAVEARAVIVTVPLGVLHARAADDGAIAFVPDLPARQRSALTRLAMGPVVKVVLLFAEPFWETIADGRYGDGAFFSGPGRFPTFWTQVPVRASLLTAWAGGPAAEALASLDADALTAAALDDAIALFAAPHARDLLLRGYVHDWQRDPFARGAYSYALVDARDARAELAQPIDGRLFLAGEATARISEAGTVAGALESGDRAANDVLAVLRTD